MWSCVYNNVLYYWKKNGYSLTLLMFISTDVSHIFQTNDKFTTFCYDQRNDFNSCNFPLFSFKMSKRCCEPGWKSNYLSTKNERYVTTSSPKMIAVDSSGWRISLGRIGVLQAQYFASSILQSEISYTDKIGEVKSYQLDSPKLSPGVAPTVFQSLPSSLNLLWSVNHENLWT